MTAIAWRWRWPTVSTDLLVSRAVADVLGAQRQCEGSVERGGQLFVDPFSPTGLLLSLATFSHPSDRAGRTWLELDAERCREEIEIANAAGLRLVGYWHTHPQTVPRMSPTDKRNFSRFAARYPQELPHPVAVIVGRSVQPDGIKAWSFRGGRYIEATWVE